MNTQMIVDMLNQALNSDQEAMNALFNHYVKTNDKMVNDPFIVVGTNGNDEDAISILGVINGIMNVYGLSRIVAHYDDNDKIVKFSIRNKGI